MTNLRKTAAALLAALALGSTFAAVSTAEARPGRHGGWHGHHGHHRPHHGFRHWGAYGLIGGAAYMAAGPRCRLVERVNAYGDVVLRRVCHRPMYY
jgi:hypothetical protein